MRWNQPLLQGPPPVPRFGHTMTLCGSKAIIFGGSYGTHEMQGIDVLDLGMWRRAVLCMLIAACRNTDVDTNRTYWRTAAPNALPYRCYAYE